MVRVWDAHTSSAVGQPLQGHTGSVTCVAVSANGTRIVSGSRDTTVCLWDAHTGSFVTMPLRFDFGLVNCVALTPDGSRIVSGSSFHNAKVQVWDELTGSAVELGVHGNTLTRVAVSADGTRFVSQDSETICLWAVNGGDSEGELTTDASWIPPRNALLKEMLWSEQPCEPQREVFEIAEDGSKIVLGTVDYCVRPFQGSDQYYEEYKGLHSHCEILP